MNRRHLHVKGQIWSKVWPGRRIGDRRACQARAIATLKIASFQSGEAVRV
jgi:hypothetical protein